MTVSANSENRQDDGVTCWVLWVLWIKQLLMDKNPAPNWWYLVYPIKSPRFANKKGLMNVIHLRCSRNLQLQQSSVILTIFFSIKWSTVPLVDPIKVRWKTLDRRFQLSEWINVAKKVMVSPGVGWWRGRNPSQFAGRCWKIWSFLI